MIVIVVMTMLRWSWLFGKLRMNLNHCVNMRMRMIVCMVMVMFMCMVVCVVICMVVWNGIVMVVSTHAVFNAELAVFATVARHERVGRATLQITHPLFQ